MWVEEESVWLYQDDAGLDHVLIKTFNFQTKQKHRRQREIMTESEGSGLAVSRTRP